MSKLNNTLIWCLLVACLKHACSSSCYRTYTKADYPNCLLLDPSFALHWSVSGPKITFAVDADGLLSWLALGLSEAGPNGVDFGVLIRGSQAQTWVLGDYFTIDFSTPILDLEQNLELLEAPVQDKTNRTSAVFSRLLDTCDKEDVPILLGVERTLMWAYSTGNWDKEKVNFVSMIRGSAPAVRLYVTPNTTTLPPPDAANFTFTMPGYLVSTASTSLVCLNTAVPSDKQYSIISYQGLINSSLLHHMHVYACAAGVVPQPEPNTVYDCSTGLPAGCETLNLLWAPGANTFTAPPQAGFLIGSNATSYLVLQVHYVNPAALSGQVDRSGFQITYTSQLRNNSLGVLSLGSYDISLPAGQEKVQLTPNQCPANCTSARVMGNVTLVSNFFMMSGLGRTIITRHIRNNTAIPPLGSRNYFDSAYTDFMTVQANSSSLQPGDILITICSYNTTGVGSGLTTFGMAPGQEICYNFVTFYPVSAMPMLDTCIAKASNNLSTCTTRSQMAQMALTPNVTDQMQILNGSLVPVQPVNVRAYRTAECEIHDTEDVTPVRVYNTKAALSSIIVVPLVLLGLGTALFRHYSKKEELEALLHAVRLAEREQRRQEQSEQQQQQQQHESNGSARV